MNKLKNVGQIFVIVLFFVVLTGCSKDTTTGTLEIEFSNHPSDLVVYISPAENINIAVFYDLAVNGDGKLALELNAGNYLIRAFSNSAYPNVYDTPGFQIRTGEITKIYFDSNNIAHLQ